MSIQRVRASEEQMNASIASFNQKVTNELTTRGERMKRRAELLADVMAPVHALIEQDPKAVSALHTLGELAAEEKRQRKQAWQARKNRKSSRGKQSFFTVSPGLNFFVPPYDMANTVQSEPSEVVLADKSAGTLEIIGDDSRDFTAGAGLGLFLTSPQTVNARFSLHMPYSFLWENDVYAPGWASSAGGIGVGISKEGGDLIVNQDVLLWSNDNSSVYPPASGSNDSYLDDSYLEEKLGEISFTMDAGATYDVWVWSWVDGSVSTTQQSDYPEQRYNSSEYYLLSSMPWIVVGD